MRYRRAFESRMEFFGDGGAADDIAAFENERPVALFREIKGRDQRVVATAENDDVALRRPLSVFPRVFQNFQRRQPPGAPMMPPPGCVAEPHI